MTQRLLMANRGPNQPEAEPVLVDTDEPNVVRLVLDDGDTLELDRAELRAALDEAA